MAGVAFTASPTVDAASQTEIPAGLPLLAHIEGAHPAAALVEVMEVLDQER